MTKPAYSTAPQAISTMPPGIPYIVGNEAAERFSFYGMKFILTAYMTRFLIGWDGQSALLSDENAKTAVHLFVAAAYFFSLPGAILSDWVLGKYSTILWLSMVYCLGHLVLAVMPGREGLALGLLLISIGAGGIKPCVSAHVGDQFGEKNQHLLGRVFSWFYFSINLGAFLAGILTPILLHEYGHHVAFGVPGVLMAIATLTFWMGRNKFIHIPPGGRAFLRESFSGEGLSAIKRLIPLYLFVAVFWSLYDQTASAWVLQAEKMDRRYDFGFIKGEWNASQLQSVNAILILVLIPFFSYAIYPLVGRVIKFTALRRIAVGFFVTALAWVVNTGIETQLEPHDQKASQQIAAANSGGSLTLKEKKERTDAIVQEQVSAGLRCHVNWQMLAYVILTCAEVLVSITALEFSYTQAPNKMKSLIMSLFLLSVTMGNLLTAAVNKLIQNSDGTTWLPGASYYWFFTILQIIAAVLFLGYAATFREKTYIQETTPSTTTESPET
jgi:POT family proton-dependent oligopeptide transporter